MNDSKFSNLMTQENHQEVVRQIERELTSILRSSTAPECLIASSAEDCEGTLNGVTKPQKEIKQH